MDPQVVFQHILDCISEKDWDGAFESLNDLFHWLNKGGFTPTIPPKTYIAISDGKSKYCYSILSHPFDIGADFIRYEFSDTTGQFEEAFKYNCIPHAL